MHTNVINEKYANYKITAKIFKEFFKNYFFTRKLIKYFLDNNEKLIEFYENDDKIINYRTFNIEQLFNILHKSIFGCRTLFDGEDLLFDPENLIRVSTDKFEKIDISIKDFIRDSHAYDGLQLKIHLKLICILFEIIIDGFHYYRSSDLDYLFNYSDIIGIMSDENDLRITHFMSCILLDYIRLINEIILPEVQTDNYFKIRNEKLESL